MACDVLPRISCPHVKDECIQRFFCLVAAERIEGRAGLSAEPVLTKGR